MTTATSTAPAGRPLNARRSFGGRRFSRPDLAQLKKRLLPRSTLALTLEAGRIVVSVVRLHLDDDGRDAVPAPPVPIRAEDVYKHPEKAGAILAAALAAAGLREKRCAVCVPPGWALTASTELPPVQPDDLRGYLELRAEREFPVALSELRLAHCAYDLPDGRRRATLAALPARRVEAVEAFLAAAGRRAVSISLALGDTFSGNGGAPTLNFLASNGHADVVVAAGGGVAALRSLPGPAAAGEGEAAGTGEFDPAAFAREVRVTLGRLPEAVGQGVRQARFGGVREFADALRVATRDALRRLGIEAREDDLAAPADETVRAQATAEAAAFRQLRREPVPFEFVVPQPRRWEAVFIRYNTRRYRWVAAALACVIFLPMLVFFGRSRYEAHLAAQWSGMQDNVADLDALQQKIRRFRPWFEPTPQTLRILEGMIEVFPEGGEVWAKDIQVNASGAVSCTGFARNQDGITRLFSRLRQRPGVSAVTIKGERGENPIQFSLSCQWEVMR